MLSHLPSDLHFFAGGAIWLVFLVCILRACKRIESAAALRLLTPALWFLAVVGAIDLLLLLNDVKDSAMHKGLSHLSVQPPHHQGASGWLDWGRLVIRVLPTTFALPRVRASLVAVAIIGALGFIAENYPVFERMFGIRHS